MEFACGGAFIDCGDGESVLCVGGGALWWQSERVGMHETSKYSL